MNSRILVILFSLMVSTAVLLAIIAVSGVQPAEATLPPTEATIRVSVAGDKPDPAFGDNGWAVSDLAAGSSWAEASAIQPSSDKIVAAGTLYDGYQNLFTVARYNTDGTLDGSFGFGGYVTIPLSPMGFNDQVHGMALAADESILVVGETQNGLDADFGIVRFSPDGFPDISFGLSGTVMTDFGNEDIARDVIVQPDGMIVVVGETGPFNAVDFALARYLPDGNLDSTFGLSGTVTSDFGGDEFAAAVTLQPNNHIVVVGEAEFGFDSEFITARYDIFGGLDPTFGSGGWIITDLGSNLDRAEDVLVQQPAGEILVAGSTYNLSKDFALVRYTTDGALDANFDGGIVVTDLGGDEAIRGLVRQGDGRVVAAGYIDYGFTSDFALARYLDTGLMDSTFAFSGTAVIDINGGFDQGYDVLLQSTATEEILVVGRGGINFALIRLLMDGSLDPSFDMDGIVQTPLGNGWDTANDITLQPDGLILAAGSAYDNNGRSDFVLSRYTPDGSKDLGFGANGVVTTDFGAGRDERGKAVTMLPDGRILVAGSAESGDFDDDFALVRYLPDGDIDPTFGVSGVITTDIDGGGDQAVDIVVQVDGRIILVGVGSGIWSKGINIALARYLADGVPDPSFGNGGVVTTTVGGDSEGLAVTLQPDGKILIAGFAGIDGGSDFIVARYQVNGVLDTTFGADGYVITDFFAGYDQANGIALQPNGKIIVVGGVEHGGGNRGFGLARYLTDGTLDTEFGQGGLMAVPILPGLNSVATDVSLHPSGTIVVGGYTDGETGTGRDFALARFLPDGELDLDFGVGGKAAFDFYDGDDTAAGLVVDIDGAILMAGRSGADTAVVRYRMAGGEANGDSFSPIIAAGSRAVAFPLLC